MPLTELFADPMARVFVLNLTVLAPTVATFIVMTALEKPADLRVGVLACIAGACLVADVFLIWSHSGLLAGVFAVQAVVGLGTGAQRLFRHLRALDVVQH